MAEPCNSSRTAAAAIATPASRYGFALFISATTFVTLLMLSLSASADDAPAFRLDLKPAEGLPGGRVAAVKAIATPKPDQFFIENAFVLQPVVITVISENPADVIKVRLGKHHWEESLMDAVTGPDGKAILKLRTQGEIRISISADEGRRPYKMLAWVGDEVKVEPEPAVMPMSEYRKANPESLLDRLGQPLIWGAVGAMLMLVIGAVVFLLIRRRGAK